MNKAVSINQTVSLNTKGNRVLFCTQIFRKYAVGVGADGDLSIRLDKNSLKKNDVEGMKELALAACDEAKVKYSETKFRSALLNLQDRLAEKKTKIVNFADRNPVLASIISPALDYARERLDVGMMRIGDYFRAHDLAKQ